MSPKDSLPGDSIPEKSNLSIGNLRPHRPVRIIRGKYYTVSEVAAFFNRSVSAVYQWIAAGAIRATKVPGRKTYISGDEVHNRFGDPLPEISPKIKSDASPEEISRMNVVRRNRRKVINQLPADKDVTFDDILRKSREIRSEERSE